MNTASNAFVLFKQNVSRSLVTFFVFPNNLFLISRANVWLEKYI